jgi:hypothetical protein
MDPSLEEDLVTPKPSNANVDGNNNELIKASLKAPAEASKDLKPALKSRANRGSQASLLPPMLKNGKLCDVVLHMETLVATGEEIYLADSLAGVNLAKLPVSMLCKFCLRSVEYEKVPFGEERQNSRTYRITLENARIV